MSKEDIIISVSTYEVLDSKCVEGVKQRDAVTKQVVRIYESVGVASTCTKLSRTGISKCCNNKRRMCGGFIWNFFDGSSTAKDNSDNSDNDGQYPAAKRMQPGSSSSSSETSTYPDEGTKKKPRNDVGHHNAAPSSEVMASSVLSVRPKIPHGATKQVSAVMRSRGERLRQMRQGEICEDIKEANNKCICQLLPCLDKRDRDCEKCGLCFCAIDLKIHALRCTK